ncbi:hypothetical protein SETIT_2G056900v2 [Setaria italica]|uniref:Uncharacterized protein n=1 Tax=Setaria italica TaxID=4555 RepID=A0A368PWG3_SETIT|nr:hypothetical protein SETIT_2G056900v2 [Setaria italica]
MEDLCAVLREPMMMKRYKIEGPREAGYSKNEEMAKRNPALAAISQKFRMIHVLSSLASPMSFGSLAIHS